MSAIQDATGLEQPTPPPGHLVVSGTCLVAALISAGVGAVHLSVAAEHQRHWWAYGAFFLAIGVFQVGFAAVLLRRPTWPVALTGIVVNVGIVLVYVLSRTVGLPITPPEGSAEDGTGHAGPDAHIGGIGPREPVGVLDLTATAGELILVALLVTLLTPRLRTATCNALLGLGLGLWALRLSGILA